MTTTVYAPPVYTMSVARLADDLEAVVTKLRQSGLERITTSAELRFCAVLADDPAATVAELASVFGLKPSSYVNDKDVTYHIAEHSDGYMKGLDLCIQASGRDHAEAVAR